MRPRLLQHRVRVKKWCQRSDSASRRQQQRHRNRSSMHLVRTTLCFSLHLFLVLTSHCATNGMNRARSHRRRAGEAGRGSWVLLEQAVILATSSMHNLVSSCWYLSVVYGPSSLMRMLMRATIQLRSRRYSIVAAARTSRSESNCHPLPPLLSFPLLLSDVDSFRY